MLQFNPSHPRGFLQNYPEDVIAVVNGIPITKADKVRAHQRRQRHQLDAKRRSFQDRELPCFVRVYYVPVFPFMGWWLYVDTAYRSFNVDRLFDQRRLALQAMTLWPCGLLPITENYDRWKQVVADYYPWPASGKSRRGQILGRAVIDSDGRLKGLRAN